MSSFTLWQGENQLALLLENCYHMPVSRRISVTVFDNGVKCLRIKTFSSYRGGETVSRVL